MNRLRFAIFAGLVLWFTHAVDAQDSKSKLGTIDLRLVYSNMQSTIDCEREIQGLQQELEMLERKRKFELGDTARMTADEVHLKQADFDRREQLVKLKMLRRQNRQMVMGYRDMQSVVATIAAERGLDLVLVRDHEQLPPRASDVVNLQALQGMIFNRNTIYASDSIDITADVIAILNKGYKSSSPSTQPALPASSMRVGSKTYVLEIAADDASRERGLMERDTLEADHGMIFVFPQADLRTFWMHHTRFPLDIIFADELGKVVSIHTMKAFDETSITESDAPAKYAIELSAGELASSGVKLGDKLLIPRVVDAALTK